jgi:radical SAM protein with 4Fe4S-binding SPASM domain
MNEPIVAREGEVVAVVHRDRFDEVPGDVTDPKDVQRWHDFRAAYARATHLDLDERFPLQVDFELTSQCNLSCWFCTQGQQDIPYRALTLDSFKAIIDEGEAHGLVSIKMNYVNEPLLAKDLEAAIRYAKAHGVLNIYFATNGILLDARRRAMLMDAGVSKIMVSIDAATSETYLKQRESSHFDRIVANVEALIAERDASGRHWPLVRVSFLRTVVNAQEEKAFLARWDGVADMVAFQDQLSVPGVDAELFKSGSHFDVANFACSLPFKLLVVDAAGHILPCCTFGGREMPLGNIETMTLTEAWSSPSMLALRTLHRDRTWRENPVCRHCVLGGADTTSQETADLIQLSARS